MALARALTHQVHVGNVAIGGGEPIAVQSMTCVPMKQLDEGPKLDVEGNLDQIGRLAEAGCEIARVAVPNRASIEPFGLICEQSPLPVVADIHFDYLIALGAIAAGAAKIRINPGNIGATERVDAVIDAAGAAGIPIRIGVNAGSLDPKWKDKEGWTTPQRLCASVLEFVQHFEDRGFSDIVVSAKVHDVMECVETYRMLSREIPQVPLHLGVTEAGTFLQGSVKSSVGLGILLSEGIGDTMRVSLTDDPVQEVRVAWEILSACGLRRRTPELVSCPTCSRCQTDMIPIAKEVEARLQELRTPIKVAVMGCIVNGPGEAGDADIGVACGKDSAIVFIGGQKVRKVPAAAIVDTLFEEIAKLDAR